MKANLKKILVFSLAVALWLLVWLVQSWPDKDTHVFFCDVSQGDAILITQGFNQVLIDAGPNEKVLNCLQQHLPFWDRSLELVVVTHLDQDHIGG
ncbi:MAG: DNA internalization-related competence protein ComEC/Rec2, partial [Candidatus Pacebacteria bacterium]|nr:DNA internalization-related competence protein ComEC/Rec2 [Candidatus Paceibacterota bacterium]